MDWKNKKVLVTGITGFIGSNLTKKLLKKGAEVWGIDNFSYIDSGLARKKLAGMLREVTLIQGDVSKKETWQKVPKDIEYIFHFAAPSSITLFKANPEKCFSETFFGLYNAFEFAKNNSSVKKVVFPSTGSLYAGNKFPHREDIYPKPRNSYAAAKVACEGLANSYFDFVNYTGLRIFAGYGPGEEWKKEFGSTLYLFARDYLNGKSPVVWGDGEQTRDFVYIDDLTEIIIKAAEIDYKGFVNIGTGRPTSFSKILEIIKSELGTEIKPEYVKKDKNYVDHLKADTNLMKKLFKVNPRLPEDGIKEFIKYLKSQKQPENEVKQWGREIWDKKQKEQGSLGVIAGTVETRKFMDNQTKMEFEILEKKVLPLLDKNAKVLDAGMGPFARFSLEFAKRGYSVTGIDVSPMVLEMAEKRIKNAGYSIKLLEEDMTDIKNVKEKQDLVFCFGTFGHIPAFLSLKVLKEFNKILKKDGYAYVHFWINGEKNIKGILHDFIYSVGHYIKLKLGMGYKVNSSFYTEDEIKEMARLSGFGIVSKTGDK